MSLVMSRVIWKDVRGREMNMDKFYIKGKQVVYVHIPDDVDIIAAMKWQLNKKSHFQAKQTEEKRKIFEKRKKLREKKLSQLLPKEVSLKRKADSVGTGNLGCREKHEASNNSRDRGTAAVKDITHNTGRSVSKEKSSHDRKHAISKGESIQDVDTKTDKSNYKGTLINEVSFTKRSLGGLHDKSGLVTKKHHLPFKKDSHDELAYNQRDDMNIKRKGRSEERHHREEMLSQHRGRRESEERHPRDNNLSHRKGRRESEERRHRDNYLSHCKGRRESEERHPRDDNLSHCKGRRESEERHHRDDKLSHRKGRRESDSLNETHKKSYLTENSQPQDLRLKLKVKTLEKDSRKKDRDSDPLVKKDKDSKTSLENDSDQCQSKTSVKQDTFLKTSMKKESDSKTSVKKDSDSKTSVKIDCDSKTSVKKDSDSKSKRGFSPIRFP